MAQWETLRDKLKLILGSNRVYFQPPETIKLQYPCIIFNETRRNERHADNMAYSRMKAFRVLYIDPSPTSTVPDAIDDIRYSSMDSFYVSDNLNHYVFTIYI